MTSQDRAIGSRLTVSPARVWGLGFVVTRENTGLIVIDQVAFLVAIIARFISIIYQIFANFPTGFWPKISP
jgi:hypothetical protein